MTLKDLLKDYFDRNEDDASDAMSGGNLWGYVPYTPKGAQPSAYRPSEFEGFAKHHGIDQPVLVEDYGGEDMGSTYYAVHKFTRGDEVVFIKFYGYYASYNGADYEGFRFVTPKEKTVVVYE